MEQPQKLKISSDFIFTKILFITVLGLLFLLLTDYKRTNTDTIIEYIVIFIVLSALLYYLFTRPDIYYDNEKLYITKGTKFNIEVSFDNIKSIQFSVIGFWKGGYSYRIKYLNENNQTKSFRLFPSMFSNPTSKFIKRVQEQNKNIKIAGENKEET